MYVTYILVQKVGTSLFAELTHISVQPLSAIVQHGLPRWLSGKESVCQCLPMQESRVPYLGWNNTLEKEMATHSNILAWEISWTEKAGGLQQSKGLQRNQTKQRLNNSNNNTRYLGSIGEDSVCGQSLSHLLPFPSPGNLLDAGIKPRSTAWQADPIPLSHLGSSNQEQNLIK